MVNDDGYEISTDPSRLDRGMIHRYLCDESYWAKQIPVETVNRSIDNSFCFGIYLGKAQVGFARLITDKATFAYLCDVFILEEHRGKGLSKWLLRTMQAHPEVQGLRRWLLGTRDAHGLYEQFGWIAFGEEQTKRFMQRHDPDAYGSIPA